MNSNETSILPHIVALPVVNKARAFTAEVLEERGTVYSTENVLRDMIAITCDNTEYELEFRITNEGFVFAFPQSVEVDMVLDDLDRALEVLRESALED